MRKIMVSLVAIAGVIFAGWLGWLFAENFQAADASIKVGVIGLFGMLIAALITHRQTKSREIKARHFEAKRQGYMLLIDLLFDIIMSLKKGKKLSENKMLGKIIPFKKALMVWGGSPVIEEWNRFEIVSQGELSPTELIQEMEKVLRALRKDLGHNDSMLKSGSLSALFLVAKDKKMAFGEE